jgi:transmembrane sensor
MTVIGERAEENRLRTEAVEWVQLLDSGHVTLADIEALKAWRCRSAAHEEGFIEARRLWGEMAAAMRHMSEKGEIASSSLRRAKTRPVLSRRMALRGGVAVAASVAGICATVRPPLGLWPSFAELSADYRTATGEQQRLALTDGVSVHLSTQTSIALRPEEGSGERLELVAGEAVFSAELHRGEPLTVLAGGGSITALSGNFDVRHTGASVCVTCIDGNVGVASRSQAAMLSRAQQISYDGHGLGTIALADVELVTAWRQGVLIFRMTPLSDVVDEINRYRWGRVLLVNKRLSNLPVSGRFRIDHVDEIIRRLNQVFGITSRYLPGGVVLLV